jgi:hypothetical protein
MSNNRIETGPAPALSVTCQGDLTIKGWDETAVLVHGDYEVEEKGDLWMIRGEGDLQVHVPHNSALHLSTIAGDTVVKGVAGDLAIETVQGDLVLRSVASVKLGNVQGDLTLRHLSGGFHAERVSGDLAFAHVQEIALDTVEGDVEGKHADGPFTAAKVQGDVTLRAVAGAVSVIAGHGDAELAAISGEVNLPSIGGDIDVRGGLGRGNHILNAGRDVILRWPGEMPLNLIATAPTVNNRLSLDEFEQKGEAWIGRIGDGKTNVELTAGRRINLKGAEKAEQEWEGFEGSGEFAFGFDMENLGERISSQINEKIAQFTRNMEQQFGPDFGREIGEKMARKAEQAAQRAEKAAERATQRAEKAADRGRKQADWGGRWGDYGAPAAATKTPPTATAEEQLKILRMVETGTISPEEASVLLEALGA